MSSDLAENLLLARYSWVLERKRDLNSVTFTISAAYLASLAFFMTASASVVVAFAEKKISKNSAELAIDGLWIALIIVSIAVVVLIGLNVKNWMEYRREECSLEKVAGVAYASQPAWSSIWGWFEFYIALFAIAIMTAGSLIFYLFGDSLFTT